MTIRWQLRDNFTTSTGHLKFCSPDMMCPTWSRSLSIAVPENKFEPTTPLTVCSSTFFFFGENKQGSKFQGTARTTAASGASSIVSFFCTWLDLREKNSATSWLTAFRPCTLCALNPRDHSMVRYQDNPEPWAIGRKTVIWSNQGPTCNTCLPSL